MPAPYCLHQHRQVVCLFLFELLVLFAFDFLVWHKSIGTRCMQDINIQLDSFGVAALTCPGDQVPLFHFACMMFREAFEQRNSIDTKS